MPPDPAAIVQGDRSVLVEVDHPGYETSRKTLAVAGGLLILGAGSGWLWHSWLHAEASERWVKGLAAGAALCGPTLGAWAVSGCEYAEREKS